ncbi:MAG: tetratricopeptide repeat protein [Treponema berlinense]|jgi:tetratricopeptide (TPR) repeat protein|uniref:tetratricopeptide repeat protein n=1 Tax=Treponema TaxID=157 RepID=UPI00235625F2|nr:MULTISPECIES: tetratricopeptide repeat protein [Treponema]MBQ9102025.1 tetratricopeptide repeat protein [Treponema sp.]MCI5542010.1 tetratricopeptide repeat protein [Treponema berlinense]MDY3706967.1 tetratricopeptide repeat protein [Treponema berlinense]
MKKSILTLIIISLFSIQSFAQQRADALVLYRNGKYAEAIKICEQEIVEDPQNIDSYCVLCWSLVRNRQYAEAEQRSAEARKINSTDVRLIEIQAEAKFYLGKNTAALELFQYYLANVPANGSRIGNAYYYMGEIYIRQAKYQHADISFSTAVHTEPLVDYWWTRCGYAREMTGNYSSALEAYSKAIELNGSNSDAIRGRERVVAKLR